MEFLKKVAKYFGSIRDWWWQPKRPQRQRQHSSCHILQLPPELILNICDFLPPVSRVLVSQTCYPLREILGDSASTAHLSYEQYLKFLTTLAHNWCDLWVCEVCPALHTVSEHDTPSARNQSMSETSRWYHFQDTAYGSRHRFDFRQLFIDHRHVQLALKYTRMRHPDYQGYLEKLLRPYHNANFDIRFTCMDPPPVVQVDYKVQPRIATATDGTPRFLTMSRWRYVRSDQERMLTPKAMGHLFICPHQSRSILIEGHKDYELSSAIETSFILRSEEICSACPFCRTDFSIRVSADLESAELHVWQDLGPEGSPMDEEWNSQVRRHSYRTLRSCGVYCRTKLATVYHEPGSIRSLFDYNDEGGERERTSHSNIGAYQEDYRGRSSSPLPDPYRCSCETVRATEAYEET